MLTWWLLIWICRSVASQQVNRMNRINIPKTENCLMKCNGMFLCQEFAECESLHDHYDLRDKEHSAISELLIYGHNGLRNRVALILNACDMLLVSWDDELAELSNRHHRNCERTVTCSFKLQNPFVEFNLERKQHQKVFLGNVAHLVRNSFFDSNIYSTNFFETAVGSWYMEHNTVEYPERTLYNADTFYKLIGDNSFTHIINPHTHRVGCSYARFKEGLSLICYYFPHIRNNTIYLRLKPEEYQCPYNFPIQDPVFKTLCGYASYS